MSHALNNSVLSLSPEKVTKGFPWSFIKSLFSSVQFISVAPSCPALCDLMDCSTPCLLVHHQLPEFTQTPPVHWVGDAVQPSHPLSSASPPTSILPSIRVFSNESVLCIRWPKYLASVVPMNNQNWFSLGWTGCISLQSSPRDSQEPSPTPQFKSINSSALSFLYSPMLTSIHAAATAKLCQSCPTLCDPIDGSPPGSSVPGILQARILEWIAIAFTHPYMTIEKNIALTRLTFVVKVMSLLFNMLSRSVITFLPRSKHLLISWLQSPSAVILEP